MGEIGGRRPGAGRPGGSMDKLTFQARTRMKELGYDPIEALIDIAKDDTTPLDLRIGAHKELCKYYAPQLKAVDLNMAIRGDIKIELISFAEKYQLETERNVFEAIPVLDDCIDASVINEEDEDEDDI